MLHTVMEKEATLIFGRKEKSPGWRVSAYHPLLGINNIFEGERVCLPPFVPTIHLAIKAFSVARNVGG